MRTGSFYEVNISKKGKHIFATDSSIRQYDEHQMVDLLTLLGEKFPPSDDYDFDVTHWHVSSPALPETVQAAIPKKERNVVVQDAKES